MLNINFYGFVRKIRFVSPVGVAQYNTYCSPFPIIFQLHNTLLFQSTNFQTMLITVEGSSVTHEQTEFLTCESMAS